MVTFFKPLKSAYSIAKHSSRSRENKMNNSFTIKLDVLKNLFLTSGQRKKIPKFNVPELRTKTHSSVKHKTLILLKINFMLRLMYMIVITNYSMYLSIHKCQQFSVVNNNNIN